LSPMRGRSAMATVIDHIYIQAMMLIRPTTREQC